MEIYPKFKEEPLVDREKYDNMEIEERAMMLE